MLRSRTATTIVALIVLSAGCGTDGAGVSRGTAPHESTSSSLVSATTIPLDPAELTESWGCGYGFNQSDEKQTVAIAIRYKGEGPGTSFADPLAGASLPLQIELPHPAWSVQYRTGSALYSNHCDDVIEPDEPTPVVIDEWEATAGTLTITATSGTTRATAVLADAMFTSPEGESFSIPELALENSGWGLFAG